MAIGKSFYPFKGVNIDRHEGLMDNETARFIRNLVYDLTDDSNAQRNRGAQSGVGKLIEANYLYANAPLPIGSNFIVGTYSSKAEQIVLVLVWNSLGSHVVYQIDGQAQAISIVYQGSCLELSNDPSYFVGKGQSYLNVVDLTDPTTNLKIKRRFFFYTTGSGTQKQICLDDSISTGGFNTTEFPYFQSTYDPCWMIRMGLSTPNGCIGITEIPFNPATDTGIKNNLIYNTWQFRITYIDVWGRPSEHGVISTLYIPGINDCISGSTQLPRCLILAFDAGSPLVNAIQVEFRNGNNDQWYVDNTLFLYDGSNIGEWWLRSRNPNITYDQGTNTISYTFCRNQQCNPVPVTETTRLENPLPNTSQAIGKIGSVIGLANNTDGFLPFSQELLSKFSVKITPPTGTTQLRNIDILVPIFNPFLSSYQQVRTNGAKGYVWGDNDSHHGGATAYSQYFTNPAQSGFGGYLAGTSNYVISTQYYLSGNGQLVEDTTFNGLQLSPYKLVFARFQFSNLQPGTYIFRLFSHLSDPTQTTNWATTSTTVWGLCPFNSGQITEQMPNGIGINQRELSQELIVNVCNSDYSTLPTATIPGDSKILVIADMAAYNAGGLLGIGSGSVDAKCGYIYETDVNGFDQYPMELVAIAGGNEPQDFNSQITDHNGFYYFGAIGGGKHYGFVISYKCGIQSGSIAANTSQGMIFKNIIMDQYVPQTGAIPVFPDYFSLPCDRILIEGQMVLAGTNIGIPNVSVVLSRSSTVSTITDDQGNFTIIAHDDVSRGVLNVRNDIVIVANSGCNYTGVNGSCVVPINVTIQPCTGACVTREISLGIITLYFTALRGLLSGGSYSIGVVGFDWLGRCGYVQPIANIIMPSFAQTGVIAPSTVSVLIDPSAVFPDWVSYISLWITAETTLSAYITWIVDRVQLVDNTGAINTLNPSQIKVYYSSLIEYNKQNNFNTTDSWSFIPATGNTPYTGDQVTFFINGDGTSFPTNISQVKYDTTGQYFLIDYNSVLATLQANALMRLMRPQLCNNAEMAPYFEVCGPVLINGSIAAQNTVPFNAFDTYYVSRQIPVPTPLTSTTAGLNVTTTTSSVSAGVTTTESYTVLNPATTDELRTFGFLFEHNSPSNFWGQGNINIGRTNTNNPYETQIYTPDGIALSGQLSPNGQLNYTNYFDSALVVSYSNSNLGGIIALIPQMSVLFVLGQLNSFKTGYSDNLVRANADGTESVQSINNELGQPETKVGQPYGCVLADKNTLSEFDGIVMFLDRNKTAVVRYDYSSAQPISYNVCDSYIVPKLKSVMAANLKGGNRYFVGFINPNNSEYLLTDFDQSKPSYLNEDREYAIDLPDTVAFDSRSGMLKGWYSNTPEYYCGLEGEINGQQLFTFKNGQPYANYSVNNPSYGTVYGQPVLPIYRFIFSLGKDKKGKLLWLEVYCKQSLYFVDQLLTETGQRSRILKAWFNQALYFWQAAALCDLNTPFDPNNPIVTGPNKLTDGNNLVGIWFDIRMVGDPSTSTTYSELQSVNAYVFNEEKSGTQ